MPKAPKRNSTERRLDLAVFIDLYGDVMPVACSNCREAKRVCRVHISSGRCSECNRSNAKDCNIRISADEWEAIRAEKERLQSRLEAVELEAQELRQALRRNADRAAEAISVEEANIQLLEQQEAAALMPGVLTMSPFTWSAESGFDDSVWGAAVPSYLGEPLGNTAPVTGGSS